MCLSSINIEVIVVFRGYTHIVLLLKLKFVNRMKEVFHLFQETDINAASCYKINRAYNILITASEPRKGLTTLILLF